MSKETFIIDNTFGSSGVEIASNSNELKPHERGLSLYCQLILLGHCSMIVTSMTVVLCSVNVLWGLPTIGVTLISLHIARQRLKGLLALLVIIFTVVPAAISLSTFITEYKPNVDPQYQEPRTYQK